MKDILVLAYAVSPTRGSEYGIAWEYILNMSKQNHLTVLYGCSGDYVGDFTEMEAYLKQHIVSNVDFVAVPPSLWTKKLNSLNERHLFVYSFYYSYQSWHKEVYKKAKELITKNHYDLVHYLNPLGYREPGYLWKLGLPYMWGPISGTCNYPSSLFGTLHLKDKIQFTIRSIVNRYQLHYKQRLKEAIKNTNLLLTCTTEDQVNFKEVHAKDSYYLPEFALPARASLNENKFNILTERINMVFVGTLDGRKAVIIQLMALAKTKNKKKIHLDIVGDGERRNELERFVIESGISENVTFHGRIPRGKVAEMFDNAHLNVITSLGEANTVTIFESISRGVPSLSLDHCGMHDTVTEKVGYPIAIKNLNQVVSDIAGVLDHIAENPDELKQKALAVVDQSMNYQWSDRESFFNKCYEECIRNYQLSQKA